MTIGLIGCGAVTEQYYARAIDVLEREGVAEVVSLYDPDLESLTRVGTTFKKATRFREFDDFLRHDVELIVVASPPVYHAQHVLLAVGAAKAVLCEKPLATTLADAQRMVEVASQAGCILAVGLVRRFFPAAQLIKHILATEFLGALRTFHCFEGGLFRWPVRSRAYFDRAVAGGGVLQDIGSHVLDLLCWWLGSPGAVYYEDDSMGGVEANCRIQLEYGKFSGEVRLSRDWERPNRYLFQGSKAWLAWYPNDANHLEIGFSGTEFAAAASLREIAAQDFAVTTGRPALNFEQSFVAQLRNVIAAARGKEATIVTAIDALHSVRLVEHCYNHRRLMPMRWLSEVEHRSAQQMANE
jgi:predicted dehydrogenase